MSNHIVATLTDLSHRPDDRGRGVNRVTLILSGGSTVTGVPEIVGDADHAVLSDGSESTLVDLSAVVAISYRNS